MKIHNGFISNSSSASFIVENCNILDGKYDKKLKKFIYPPQKLSIEEIKKLKRKGFIPVSTTFPFHIEGGISEDTKHKVKKDEPIENLGFYISCNQDEIIVWLLKNNIPFKCLTDYGAVNYFYKRNSLEMTKLYNFGNDAEHSLDDIDAKIEEFQKVPKIEKIAVKSFIEGNRR